MTEHKHFDLVDQLNEKQALAFAESGAWECMSDAEVADFQFFQRLLCMPFSRFHEAVEKVLGRPVYTHEFGLNYDGLVAEYMGERKPPSLQEIIEMIPEDKRVVIVAGKP